MNDTFNEELKNLKKKFSEKMDMLHTVMLKNPLGKDGYVSEERKIRKWYENELNLLMSKYEVKQ